MKKVLIISQFSYGESDSKQDRFKFLASLLAKNYKVELLVSSFYHTTKQQRILTDNGKLVDKAPSQENLPYDVSYIYEPGYHKNVCLKRLSSHRVFGGNIYKHLHNSVKPDLIYCAIPSLDAGKAAAKYAREEGIPFIIDVQDLWPEAFQMVLNIPAVSDIMFYPMKKDANFIYSNADAIIAVSDTYVNRASEVNLKTDNGLTVFLGTEFSNFDIIFNKNKAINNDFYTLIYVGTLGHSYDLKCAIEAFDIIQQNTYDKPVKMLVLGDGPLQQEFEKYAREKNVNVEFKGRLPYDKMVTYLANADIALNPIVKGAAQSIINKHADYAAAGLPVVSTQECNEYQVLLNKYNAGFNCVCGNSVDMADKIDKLLSDSDLRLKMSKGSRLMGEMHFNRENTYNQIIDVIDELLK